MSDQQWETIDIPQGAFIGWGTNPGQHVTGKIISYAPVGGTDFNGEACPQITVDLAEPAASFNKAGERTDYPAGELVNLTIGQVGLKTAIQRADLNPGDLVKITLTGLSPTKKGNTIKNFDLKVARGVGGPPAAAAPAQTFQAAPAFDQAPAAAQPPF